jgi:hypothetical protein
MRNYSHVVFVALITVACIAGATNGIHAEEVSVQNSTTDKNNNDQPIDLRVVMVHLETSELKLFDIEGNQTKDIGTLKKGAWAVVMTRKVNNKREYVGGGVAAVIFPKTLVALFNTGVDVADNNN